MSKETEGTVKRPEGKPPAGRYVQIQVRLYREELDEVKDETGAAADATAVACFVRKNLRRRVRQ